MRARARICPGVSPEWPALATTGPLLASPGWLRAMDGRLGDQIITILVDIDGVPTVAALASVQPVPRPGEFFDLHHVLVGQAPALPLTDQARTARAELASTAPDPPQWTPNLVVMLPGYECAPVGPGAHDPAALGLLVDEAVRYAQTANLRAVAFLYTRPQDLILAQVLAERDFVAVPLSLHWELPVPSGGLPEYLASMPRKRRREVQRELAKLTGNGVVLRRLDPTEVCAAATLDILAGLRGQLVRKYRGRVDQQAERRRLDRLVHDVAGGQPTVFAAFTGETIETMVGFALFAAHADEWHCLAVGYDYTDPRSRLTYFATAFYTAVPAAAAAHVRRIGYGQGAAAAKRARGCVGTVRTGWIRAIDQRLAGAVRASAAITRLID